MVVVARIKSADGSSPSPTTARRRSADWQGTRDGLSSVTGDESTGQGTLAARSGHSTIQRGRQVYAVSGHPWFVARQGEDDPLRAHGHQRRVGPCAPKAPTRAPAPTGRLTLLAATQLVFLERRVTPARAKPRVRTIVYEGPVECRRSTPLRTAVREASVAAIGPRQWDAQRPAKPRPAERCNFSRPYTTRTYSVTCLRRTLPGATCQAQRVGSGKPQRLEEFEQGKSHPSGSGYG
jgi:hypothetical protein